jgi:tetratricopeptide (TPR) repeat protein
MMRERKCYFNAFSLTAIVAVALISMFSAYQAWLTNEWSVQYTRHSFSPTSNQPLLAVPPARHVRAAFWLASTALQSGNPALAEKLIVLQVAQGDQLAMHLMANALLAQDDFSGAVAMWQQARDVDLLLRAASQAQQAGRLDEALMAYEVACRLDSESGTLPLANFLIFNRQEYVKAENVLRQSLATLPNSRYRPDWFNRLGDALRGQKRWDEAVAIYETVIVQTPDNWDAHIGLGWAMYERGDGLQAAMSEFQEATNTPESQGNGQFAIAQVLRREKQYGEADAWFSKALALNPEAQWWYVERGDTAWQAGNLALAVVVYQETIARFPDFAFAYYQISYVYQLNQQPTQAIAAIEQALVLMAPPSAYYYARAGEIYEWIGNESQALYDYHQALLIDPQNAVAIESVKRLGK